jgi:hypothetical protein
MKWKVQYPLYAGMLWGTTHKYFVRYFAEFFQQLEWSKKCVSSCMQCMLYGALHKKSNFIRYFAEFFQQLEWSEKCATPCMQGMLMSALQEYFTRYFKEFSSIWKEVKKELPPVCSVCYTGHSTWRVILLYISRNFSSSWNEVKSVLPPVCKVC